MQMMSDAGIPNYEILEIATKINAAILDLEQNLGSIEPGKLADLVLVEDNPIENLQNAGRVSKVWRSGEVVYDKQLPLIQ
jgi:imidazolonepropionase-like amidohydrolase